MDYQQYWDEIMEKQGELNAVVHAYWSQYSDLGNWQFWVIAALFVTPLVLLYFTVDRKRIFELFFFGFVVHLLWTYIDLALGRSNYFLHTYFLTSILPHATNMTASVLPVAFLLLYQYCTSRNKNFYLYTILLSAVFATVFATTEEYIGFVIFNKGFNQFHLFLIDVGIVYIAYWFTRLLLRVGNREHHVRHTIDIDFMRRKAR